MTCVFYLYLPMVGTWLKGGDQPLTAVRYPGVRRGWDLDYECGTFDARELRSSVT